MLTRKLIYTKTIVLLDVGDYIQYWMYVNGAYETSYLKFIRNNLIIKGGLSSTPERMWDRIH